MGWSYKFGSFLKMPEGSGPVVNPAPQINSVHSRIVQFNSKKYDSESMVIKMNVCIYFVYCMVLAEM